MSSHSANPTDAVVIGGWPAMLLATELAERGGRTTWLRLRSRSDVLTELPVYVGNGECWENARLIMGDGIAGRLWDLSRRNFERAAAAAGPPGRLLWLASDEREAGLLEASAKAGGKFTRDAEWLREGNRRYSGSFEEPLLRIQLERLRRKAIESGVHVIAAERVEAIESAGTLAARVRAVGSGTSVDVEAPIVVVASDELPPRLLPSVADKWLPVTLSWFRHRALRALPADGVLFHLGADFAFAEGDRHLRLGSFRNLFEDRASGVHDVPDRVTRDNVRRFFSELGWIARDGEESAGTTVESLGCDGLPVVGALAPLPGVFFVGGFSGRATNFLFEIAAALADGIVKDRGFEALDIFSTKRFT